METTIEPVNFNASQKLLDRINEIFNDLDKYHDRIVGYDVYLESLNRAEEDDKIVKIKVFIPGHDLFVEEVASDFISAAQQTHSVVKRKVIELKNRDKDNRNPRPDKP